MQFTEQLTQALAVVGQIPASNHTNNTDTSVAGIDMSTLRRIIAYLDCGVYGTGANVQLYWRASATANMANPTNVASAIPLTANTNNRVESLEMRADQMPSGTRYAQPVLIVNNTNAAFVGMIVLASASYYPANQYNVASTLDQGLVT